MTSTPMLSSSYAMLACALVSNDVSASAASSSPRMSYLAPSYEPPLAEDGRPAFWLVFFESVAIGFIGTFFLVFFVITVACLCRSLAASHFGHSKRSLSRGCCLIFRERERHPTPIPTSGGDEPVHYMTQTPMTTWAIGNSNDPSAISSGSLSIPNDDEAVHITTQTLTPIRDADKDIHLVLNPGSAITPRIADGGSRYVRRRPANLLGCERTRMNKIFGINAIVARGKLLFFCTRHCSSKIVSVVTPSLNREG